MAVFASMLIPQLRLGSARTLSQSSAKTPSDSIAAQVLMTFIHSISAWVPSWLIGVITIAVPAAVVLLSYRWFTRRLIRLARRYSPFLQQLLARGQGPASVIIVVVVSGLALAGADFPAPVTRAIAQTLLVAFV